MIVLPVSRRTMLLKRRREEFASVQGQLLHFQEDSTTDEGKQIKEETFATFIAVDKYVVVFEIHWPVQVAITKGGYNCTTFWPRMSSSARNMWRNYTGVTRFKYSNCDHVGGVYWWQNKIKTEWNIFLSSSSPVNTSNLYGHWLLCLIKSSHSCSSFRVCSWWSPSWWKGTTIINSFCYHCITEQCCMAAVFWLSNVAIQIARQCTNSYVPLPFMVIML